MAHWLSFAHLFFATLALLGPVLSWVLLHRPLEVSNAIWLRRIDTANGLTATAVLLIGLVRLFYFGKGPDFYFHNLPFIGKLVLYAVASGLSLVCTREIRQWASPLQRGQAPVVSAHTRNQMRRAVGGVGVCVLGMAACASLAARGIGAFSPARISRRQVSGIAPGVFFLAAEGGHQEIEKNAGSCRHLLTRWHGRIQGQHRTVPLRQHTLQAALAQSLCRNKGRQPRQAQARQCGGIEQLNLWG